MSDSSTSPKSTPMQAAPTDVEQDLLPYEQDTRYDNWLLEEFGIQAPLRSGPPVRSMAPVDQPQILDPHVVPFSLRQTIVRILKAADKPFDTVDEFLNLPSVQSVLAQCASGDAFAIMKTFLNPTQENTKYDVELEMCGMTRAETNHKLSLKVRQMAHPKTLEPKKDQEQPHAIAETP